MGGPLRYGADSGCAEPIDLVISARAFAREQLDTRDLAVLPVRTSGLTVVGQPAEGDSAPPRTLIHRVLELDALQSERLEGALLKAIGCTAVRKPGKPGDGGVDVRAKLNAAALADVQLVVQVKRYRATGIIGRAMVQQLRSAIPTGGHGLFVTTSAFSPDAK